MSIAEQAELVFSFDCSRSDYQAVLRLSMLVKNNMGHFLTCLYHHKFVKFCQVFAHMLNVGYLIGAEDTCRSTSVHILRLFKAALKKS